MGGHGLEFATTEELAAEFKKRFNVAIIIGGRRKTEEEKAAMRRTCDPDWHDDNMVFYETCGGPLQLVGLARFVDAVQQMAFDVVVEKHLGYGYEDSECSSDGDNE